MSEHRAAPISLVVLLSSRDHDAVVNTVTNRVVRLLGKDETVRWMNLSLYQGAPAKKGITTVAMAASANPILADKAVRDPTLFCTALKRQRFYMFTRSEPEYVPSLKNPNFPHPLFPPVFVDPGLTSPGSAERVARNRATAISSTSARRGKSSRSPLPRLPQRRRARQRSRRPRRSTRRWATCTCGCSRSKLPRLWRTSWATRGAGTTTASSSTA